MSRLIKCAFFAVEVTILFVFAIGEFVMQVDESNIIGPLFIVLGMVANGSISGVMMFSRNNHEFVLGLCGVRVCAITFATIGLFLAMNILQIFYFSLVISSIVISILVGFYTCIKYLYSPNEETRPLV